MTRGFFYIMTLIGDSSFIINMGCCGSDDNYEFKVDEKVLNQMIIQNPAYPDNDTSVYKYILKDVFVGDGVKKTHGYVT